jgi:RNA polymerase sigma factor (sigma-70 family)
MDTDQIEQLYYKARAVGALDRHIGVRLRARRLLRQMSEQWLADALGLRLDDLIAMEAGSLRIGPRRLSFIAVALDVADRYFFLDFISPVANSGNRPDWLRDVDCWYRDKISPYENLFLSIARRLVGSSMSARDLVHEAYAQLMVDERWRTIENPQSYLRRSIRSLARDFMKKNRIVQLRIYEDGSEPDILDERPGPDMVALDRDHLRRVVAALRKLPPKCRRAMILRKIDGLSGPEIAARMGISLKGVEINLTRGMVALNKHLEADDVGTGVGATLKEMPPPDTSIAD